MRGYKIFWKEHKEHAVYDLYTQPDHKKHYFEVGQTYYYDKEVEICQSGFHFCKNILDLFKFYPLLDDYYIAVCEVEADGKIIESDNKNVCDKITLIRELSFEEIEKELTDNIEIACTDTKFTFDTKRATSSSYLYRSENIKNSDYITDSYNIVDSDYVSDSFNITSSKKIMECSHISNSKQIFYSYFVEDSTRVYDSKLITSSDDVVNSSNIHYCYSIANSKNIRNSKCILYSKNIDTSFAIENCSNLSYSLFCIGIKNKENYFFNQKVNKEELTNIRQKLNRILDCWHPYLLTPHFKMNVIPYKRAWGKFSVKAMEYLYKLKYFDLEIFKQITDIDIEKFKFYEE